MTKYVLFFFFGFKSCNFSEAMLKDYFSLHLVRHSTPKFATRGYFFTASKVIQIVRTRAQWPRSTTTGQLHTERRANLRKPWMTPTCPWHLRLANALQAHQDFVGTGSFVKKVNSWGCI